MTTHPSTLPQTQGKIFLTDGGLETTLIFHDGYDLPMFEAFTLLESADGRSHLYDYYARHIEIAKDAGVGFLLESPTWRSNPDWGQKVGYSDATLSAVNREAIRLMARLRRDFQTDGLPIVISGCVGPRGDGYDPGAMMTAEEAERYHAWQIGIFADTDADLATAITMTNIPEAVGIARAAKSFFIPAVISFTVETDGRLPTGDTLEKAITTVDEETGGYPAYYMINCAHPAHFRKEVKKGVDWTKRLLGLRANASRMSHEELDNSTELDAGDPHELGQDYRALLDILPHATVLGGCCGTDHRHIGAICKACTGSREAA